jgi:predicted thioesterase
LIEEMIENPKTAAGKTAAVSMTVSESDTARAAGSGSLDVFATPAMIALMERAACAALSGALEEGQTSVGTQIDISHTAASRVGAAITATATITGVDGRKIEFAVAASDDRGEIGSGRHTRVIVDETKFMAKASGTVATAPESRSRR